MAEMLQPLWGRIPIEREYEGWIARGIEDYFDSLGRPTNVITVSQNEEAGWPADQAFEVRGKLIGLQLKCPKLGETPPADPGFDALRWQIGKDKAQFDLMKEYPEI